jgi:hypothetical protein
MADIPSWRVKGDWFDTCNCSIPCPCTFAQPPTGDNCEGVLAWHIRTGLYGDVGLDGLNVMALGIFKGNIWEGHRRRRWRCSSTNAPTRASAKRCR